MNLVAMDLNLLVALDALLREGSVSRAAVRIGLSQPATSHALRRLRETVGDPLLVRSGARMQLTPRALALREPLAAALAQLQGLFEDETFDPATSRRQFKAMMPDMVASVLLPPLVARLGAEAPDVRLHLTPFVSPWMVTPELVGALDLVVSYQGHDFAGFHRQRLYMDTDAIAVRAERPKSKRLSKLKGFLAARHVAVVGRGESVDAIDRWLEDEGIRREVALTVPGYLQALHAVARSDLVAFVPSRLIRAVGPGLGLKILPPPLDPGEDEQLMYYPARVAADPAAIWLRQVVTDVAVELA